MADIVGIVVSSAPVSGSKISEENENICLCCEKFKIRTL
jgi:hypothetical protein